MSETSDKVTPATAHGEHVSAETVVGPPHAPSLRQEAVSAEAHGGAEAPHSDVAQAEDVPLVGRIFTIGVIGVAVTVVAIFISLGFQRSVESTTPEAATPAVLPGTYLPAGNYGVLHREYLVEKPGESANGEAQHLRREQEVVLGTYGWVDRPRGLIRIPITNAMDQVVQAYGQRK